MELKFNKNVFWSTYIVVSLMALFIMDGFIQPGYWTKSLVKFVLFGLLPMIELYREKRLPKSLLNFDTYFKWILLSCFGLVILIISGYTILQSLTSFSNIPNILNEQVAVNLDNFLWVGLYIVIVNSFLEEFFFRFLFLNVFEHDNGSILIILSALSFSLYHVGILFGWFDLWLFLLMVLGLFLVGIFFIRLNSKPGSIANSYLIHLSANIGINIVGFIILKSFH